MQRSLFGSISIARFTFGKPAGFQSESPPRDPQDRLRARPLDNVGVQYGLVAFNSERSPRHNIEVVGQDTKLRNGIEIGHVHFRGSFGKYVRDEHLLTLEEAIRKMTSKVAARVVDHRKFGAFSHDSRQNSRNNHRGFAQEEQ